MVPQIALTCCWEMTLKITPWDSPEDLFGYALIHCETPRGLFARRDVIYLLKLAGRCIPDHEETYCRVVSSSV